MKNGIIIGFIGTFIAVSAFFFFLQQYNPKANVPSLLVNNLANQETSSLDASAGISLFNVAKHNTANDCWIVISDKAYSLQNVETKEISDFCRNLNIKDIKNPNQKIK